MNNFFPVFYDQNLSRDLLKLKQPMISRAAVPYFSQKYLFLISYLAAVIFIFLNGGSLKATELQEEELLTPQQYHRRATSPKQDRSQAVRYYYHRDDLELSDLKSILTLLADNPKSKSEPLTEIVKDDFGSLKVHFQYNARNFLEKDLRILTCKKNLIAQGHVCFITTFADDQGTMGRTNTLTLNVHMQSQSVSQPQNSNVKFTDCSRFKEKNYEAEEYSSFVSNPEKKKKRSFSFGNSKHNFLDRPFSPKSPKKITLEINKINSQQSDSSFSPPMERPRAKTDITVQSPASPTKERMKKFAQSVSSRFNKSGKEKIISPSTPETNPVRKRQELRKSKSFPILRARQPLAENAQAPSLQSKSAVKPIKKITVKPIERTKVKERVEQYENKIRN